jgi:Zn-dependent protease
VSIAPVEGGRPLLKGKLFGFPVHLDISFVIIMGILGWYPGADLTWIVLWLLITPVAVLVHELGHAVVARTTGAEPHIALAGFGGVTTYIPPRPLSRARSLAISLAGPGVGLAVGLLLLVVRETSVDRLDPIGWPSTALEIGIFTCIGWGLLNLLPILPLDGGQAMRELLPGDPAVREHRAAGVSVVVAGLAAVIAYLYFSQVFLAFFLVFFGVSNIFAFRQTVPAGAGGPRPAPASGQQQVLDLVWQNRAEEARRALEALPAQAHTDLALHGAVLALSGDPQQGHALLEQEAQRRPGDRDVAALFALTYGLEHDWDKLVAYLQSPTGPSVPPPVVQRVIEEARGTGREDVAGRLTLITRESPA